MHSNQSHLTSAQKVHLHGSVRAAPDSCTGGRTTGSMSLLCKGSIRWSIDCPSPPGPIEVLRALQVLYSRAQQLISPLSLSPLSLHVRGWSLRHLAGPPSETWQICCRGAYRHCQWATNQLLSACAVFPFLKLICLSFHLGERAVKDHHLTMKE